MVLYLKLYLLLEFFSSEKYIINTLLEIEHIIISIFVSITFPRRNRKAN